MRMLKMAAEGKLCIVFLSALCTTLLLGTTIAAQPAEARSVKYNLDIPSQNLNDALQAFALASQHKLLYSSELVDGKKSPALKGQFTAEQAVKALLSGTNLSYQVTSDGLVLIRSADPPPATNSVPLIQSDSGGQSIRLAQANPTATSTGNTPTTDNQSAPNKQSKSSESEKTGLDEIVVTGTHIRGVDPSSPLIPITREDIDRSGYTSVGDVIRSLPQNFGGGNSPQVLIASAPGADNISVSGGSAPNLRGLGAGSTLSLVNGHRLADDSTTGAVDVSLIPLAAIDHIDVVTDGASAAYGSDAVGGVVNFVLKKDFDGAQTSLLGGGTAQGGATERQINQLVGKSWASGGALLDYEFDKLDPIYSTQRDYSTTAFSPTTVLPGSSKSSFFTTAHQDLSAGVAAFMDALYTSRTTRDSISYASLSLLQEISVREYSVTTGLDIALPHDWKLSPLGSFSEQRTFSSTVYVPPSHFPGILYEGRTKYADVNADGPLMSLPSGTVHAAMGGGYRRETYDHAQQGYPSLQDAQRGVGYAYSELAIPLIPNSDRLWRRRLDLDLSGRYEHYSDFGSEAVPKVGLVYAPAKSLKLRGTWGKAFRAPTLFDLHNVQDVLLISLPDPRSPIGVSKSLVTFGGNTQLTPETAKTWTLGLDYDSGLVEGLHAAVTYYSVAYRNRISRIANFYTGLIDPLNAPFVIRSPSATYQQSLIDSVGPNFINATGKPYNPADVAAIVNFRYVNVASQDLTGVDLTVRYERPVSVGSLNLFANATAMDLRQQLVPLSPEVEVSGQAFQPAKFRARGGASWTDGVWATTGVVNFTGPEVNTYKPNLPHVSSWTTVDLQVSLRPSSQGFLKGTEASLSVQNVFDRNPPFLLFDQFVPGLHYDPLNANVLGRVISLRLSKAFQ